MRTYQKQYGGRTSPPSCLSSGRGELVSRIESNMPFCTCVRPYAYAYAVVKTRIKADSQQDFSWENAARWNSFQWPLFEFKRSKDFMFASNFISHIRISRKRNVATNTTHVQYTQTDTIRQTDGPLVPMVRLVPIEKHPIPMVLLVNMHLI